MHNSLIMSTISGNDANPLIEAMLIALRASLTSEFMNELIFSNCEKASVCNSTYTSAKNEAYIRTLFYSLQLL